MHTYHRFPEILIFRYWFTNAGVLLHTLNPAGVQLRVVRIEILKLDSEVGRFNADSDSYVQTTCGITRSLLVSNLLVLRVLLNTPTPFLDAAQLRQQLC